MITLLGVSQLKPVSVFVRTYVLTYIRPSTNRFSDLNKIWCVGRGQ